MKIFHTIFLLLILTVGAQAQKAEVKVTLNEAFFNNFLDAIFSNLDAPRFVIAKDEAPKKQETSGLLGRIVGEINNITTGENAPLCDSEITLLRENSGVKTAVKLSDGRILAPLAFRGKYKIPLVGCTDFSGTAESEIALEFRRETQSLIGRINVQNVSLDNIPSQANGIVRSRVQQAIDEKMNPLEILRADKFSLLVPMQNAGGTLKMNAVEMKPYVAGGELNIIVVYEFAKN